MTPAQKKENQLYLNITGMHCASCANIIERSLKKVSGVKDANVNLMMRKGFVEAEDNVKDITFNLFDIYKKAHGMASPAIGRGEP